MTENEKLITGRIDLAEKHIGNLSTSLGEYTQKIAKLRNSGDSLTQFLNAYGQEESINKTLREALLNTAGTLATVQDYRNIEVELLENLILPPLMSYRTICRNSKELLRSSFDDKKKEVSQQKNIERTKNKYSTNKQHILQADARLKRVQKDIAKNSLKIDGHIDTFESKKLEDLKKILVEFMQTELAFHVKAVELYTQAYNEASNIDCEQDLEGLRNLLKGAVISDEVIDIKEEEGHHEPSYSTTTMFGTADAKRTQLSSEDKDLVQENIKIQDYEEIDIESSSDE